MANLDLLLDWSAYNATKLNMLGAEELFINADCLSVLPLIKPGSINLVLTDPPYNVSDPEANPVVRNGGKFRRAKPLKLDFGKWDHGIVHWTDWIDLVVPLLDQHGVLVTFYNALEIGDIGQYLESKHGFKVRHIGAWVKTNPAPQARKVKWANGLELFLVATKNCGSGHHFNYTLGQSPSYFLASVSHKHLHPTQKPLSLIEWIVRYWSFEGDVVLDPFAGAGTTALACAKSGRHCISIEIDSKYYQIGVDRLSGAGFVVQEGTPAQGVLIAK